MGEKEETVLSDEFKEGLGDADLEEEVTIDEDLDDDDEGKKEEVVDEDESEEEAAAYNSDFKYRVKDREFEVDDFLRSIITDEATEKQVVDLLTKAKGLEDTVKSRDKLREENETTGKMYKEYIDKFAPAVSLYDDGKKEEALLSVFSKEDILRTAMFIDEYDKAEPGRKIEIENRFKSNYDSYSTEKAMTSTEQELAKERAVNLSMSIDHAIHFDNEIKEFVDWYDSYKGNKKGSFKNKVYNHGALDYNETNKLLPPDECVRQVYNEFSKFRPAKSDNIVPTRKVSTDTHEVARKATSPNKDLSRKDRIPNMKSTTSTIPKVKKEMTFKDIIAAQRIEDGLD